MKSQGFTKGLLGQGLFMIKTKGEGKLFKNTFGAIDKLTLDPGKTLIIDNTSIFWYSAILAIMKSENSET